MDEDMIDAWANALFRADATLASPPSVIYSDDCASILDSNSHSTTSFVTARSRSTLELPRPVRLRQAFRSLADFRSARNSFSMSSASLSASYSSDSSVVPNIGYLSGKAIYWLGERMLSAAEPVEIKRRLWFIRRLSRRGRKLASSKYFNHWMEKEAKALHSAALDLLEIASSQHDAKLKTLAASLAGDIRSLFYFLSPPEASVRWHSSLIRMSLASDTSWDEDGTPVRAALLDMCLQDDSFEISGPTWIGIAALLCSELTDDLSSPWMCNGYRMLDILYHNTPGQAALKSLEESPGSPLSVLARRFFDRDTDDSTFCWGIKFFAHLALTSRRYDRYLEGRTGISLVCDMLKAERNKQWPDYVLLKNITQALVAYALCGLQNENHCLAKLLDVSVVISALQASLSFSLERVDSIGLLNRYPAWGLQQIMVLLYIVGKDSQSFREAVAERMTDELQTHLVQGIFHSELGLGMTAARVIHAHTRLLWPESIAEIDKQLKRLGSSLPAA